LKNALLSFDKYDILKSSDNIQDVIIKVYTEEKEKNG
jgi:hypothetical protein